MPIIKLANFEIEAETLDLLQLVSSLKEMLSPIVEIIPPLPETWEDIYEDDDNDIHPEYNLHLRVEYNDEKDIAIILIWAAEKSGLSWDRPYITRITVFSDKNMAIRRALSLWDEYNDKDTIAGFITKHKAKSAQEQPEEQT